MSLPRQPRRPRRAQRPSETWQDYARYLEACGWSCREIGERLGKHHTSVLYAINPEFRRDKLRDERRQRAERSADDVRLDTLARAVRKRMAAAAEQRA